MIFAEMCKAYNQLHNSQNKNSALVYIFRNVEYNNTMSLRFYEAAVCDLK